MCVLISSTILSEAFLILWRNERDMIKNMYIGPHIKYPLFLSDFNESEFSRQFFENTQISNFMNTRPVGAEVFHTDGRRGGRADGRTDRPDEGNSRFSKFCERS